MPRFKLIIQYDGSEYFGWQTQKTGRTIQKLLEKILENFNEENPVKVIGSGRTDSGVHALGQVVHFDLNTLLDTFTLKKALNAKCPEDIFILSCEVVSPDFHARYSAILRTYRYQVYTGTNPLFRNQAWFLPELNIALLNNLSKNIIGEQNFLSFSKWNKDVNNTICNISQSSWRIANNMVIFTIKANRFLHHMVRYLTGTMIAVEQNKYSKKEFINLLKYPRKNVALHKAPPQGLFLEKVDYEI